MIRKSSILVTLLCFIMFKASAQETKTYTDGWFLLLNHYKFNEKWSAGNEIHWRNTDFLGKKEQLLLRPFVTLKPNKVAAYTIGYTYIVSYPYAPNTIPEPKPEHNIWEQVTLSHTYKKLSFSHRFRLEHRFQGNLVLNDEGEYKVDEYTFSNRFRYRLTLKRPIGKKFFMHIFDELWVKMNGSFQYPAYGRNWLYVGLGYKILKSAGNIQLAYLHQNIHTGNQLFEVHPTAQLTFQYDFDLSKK